MKSLYDKFCYSPVLRSSEAEIEALEHVPASVLDEMLPIIELTKSRRTSRNELASVARNIDKLKDILQSRPFILDLTLEADYSNIEIDRMIDDYQDGYSTWLNFLDTINMPNVIPVIHMGEQAPADDFQKQIHSLVNKFNYVAFRIDLDDLISKDYYDRLTVVLAEHIDKLFLIVNVGFVRYQGVDKLSEKIKKVVADKLKQQRFNAVTFLSSGYPNSVRTPGYYDNDKFGHFNLADVMLHNELKDISELKGRLIHGDYGGLHPKPSKGFAPTWAPRVDYPLDESIYYYRQMPDLAALEKLKAVKSKDVSGVYGKAYQTAASNVLKSSLFEPTTVEGVTVWGLQIIQDAANGNVFSTAPRKWISVRCQLHLCRQVLRNSLFLT